MRTTIPLLQLLALGHQAAASVCRPRVTSSSVSLESVTTSASTAASSTISSTGSESTTWTNIETVSSSTEAASSSTESASLSTTDSSTVISTTTSVSESISTDSSTITSSTLFTSTTSTTEASSITTSSVPEGPPELLINRGFENKDSLSPWERYQIFGTLDIATDVSHRGDQSAHITWTSPTTPWGQYSYYTGVKQLVPVSQILADTPYEFSTWVKMDPNIRCDNFYIACVIGGNGYIPASYKPVPIPSTDWVQVKTTCQWTQAWLNMGGPGVTVSAYCKEASYYVDDASFKQIV
ncbi:hypothetical protein N0V84_000601 [Fusarium piperis]|uniref:Uncharacterized protein n=1 Tax=Fusarium piperis TaxID=1435070 RepID=A0A9W8WMA0_9HYPO|nr:hypothetical protein N0V84_000601 [Fusarium piperis]